MESSEALTVATNAAQGFQVFQCQQCAEKLRQALQAAGHRGQQIEIRGAGGRDFMICLSYDGGQSTITQNGRHVGVRVGDIVVDNLHPNGMPFDRWIKDFDAIGGVVVHSAVDF
ncbi:MAG: papain fold toxin domain-containing protein [Gemmataceae bacterium]